MAITDNYSPNKTLGNGSTTVFTGNWDPISADYFKVYTEVVATGVQALVSTSDYTLEFDDDGYTLTMDTAPSSAYYLIRAREVDLGQNSPYTTSKGFQGAVLENSLDKLTAITQDLNDDVVRAPKFALGSSTDDITFPEPAASELIRWNAAGTDLETVAAVDAGVITVSAFAETLLDDTTAAAARGTLGSTTVGDAVFIAATAAAARTAIGAVIGTDVQAYDADLAAIAALSTQPYGRALLALVDAAAGIAALGLGTIATQNANNVSITGGSVTGISGSSTALAGTGSGTVKIAGIINSDVGNAVGNVGGGTDDLLTYTLPANSLSGNQKSIRITCIGRTANNANAKTLALLFGGSTVVTRTMATSVANTWALQAIITRTGSGAQGFAVTYFSDGATNVGPSRGVLSITDTATIVIKMTGAATSDSDIIHDEMIIEFLN